MQGKKVAVIGGGAAGFFFAINLAEKCPDAQISILEKSTKFLSKVKVSGGGRCNVTNATFANSKMADQYPRGKNLLKKILEQFNAQSTVEWFEKRGVTLKTEPDNRIFPNTDSSETIILCFQENARRLGIQLRPNQDVHKIEKGNMFTLQVNEGQEQYDAVFLASGGKTKLEAYDWIQELGITIEPPIPSLFTFNLPKHPFKGLEGVALPVSVKLEKSKLQETGPLLFTHWGLSGPVILRLSAWGAKEMAERNYELTAFLNFTPDTPQQRIRDTLTERRITAKLKTIASNREFNLPSRFWEKMTEMAEIPNTMKWMDISNQKINKLTELLTNFPVEVKGKTTFKEEFVTCGGISLLEVNANTMEFHKIPNLYAGGEVLDVDGITGGFNFQNAWSTAWVAANALANKWNA